MINTNNIKAVIFDMDGVIVDSEKLHFESEFATCREFGIMAPPEAWKEFHGCKADYFFGALQERYGTRGVDLAEIIKANAERYMAIAEKRIKLIDGFNEFIVFARKKFQKIGLATSGGKYNQELVFKKFGLDPFFDVVLTGRDFANSKPHPEPYILASEKLEFTPEECLVIEDAVNGVISAKAAGCRVAGLAGTFTKEKLLAAGADLAVSSYEELKSYLDL